MAKKHALFLLAFLFLMMLINGGKGQGVADNSAYGLVSDGVGEVQQSAFIVFKNWASSDSCDQTYGFLPCTATVLGNIFLILVYGYLMFIAAKFLSDGSEILLGILGPGIIGGLFLPVLSAFPDAVIILGKLEIHHTVLIHHSLFPPKLIKLISFAFLFIVCVLDQ